MNYDYGSFEYRTNLNLRWELYKIILRCRKNTSNNMVKEQ